VIASQPKNITMPEHDKEHKVCSHKASTRKSVDEQRQRLTNTKNRMGNMFTPNQVLGPF